MRKKSIIILLFISSFSIKNASAQLTSTTVNDTLTHLQNIVNNKTQYIGQPFSKLLDSLQIQIKFFSPFGGIPYDKNKETSTEFSFYFPITFDEIYLTYPSLKISWLSYMNINQSNNYYSLYRSVGWNTIIRTFYSTGIVADIQLIK